MTARKRQWKWAATLLSVTLICLAVISSSIWNTEGAKPPKPLVVRMHSAPLLANPGDLIRVAFHNLLAGSPGRARVVLPDAVVGDIVESTDWYVLEPQTGSFLDVFTEFQTDEVIVLVHFEAEADPGEAGSPIFTASVQVMDENSITRLYDALDR